jgi:hypothetical protein
MCSVVYVKGNFNQEQAVKTLKGEYVYSYTLQPGHSCMRAFILIGPIKLGACHVRNFVKCLLEYSAKI